MSCNWGAILCASTGATSFECVAIALQAGADPNTSTPTEHRSCLRYAIERAFYRDYLGRCFQSPGWDIVELLLQHGARPYATGDEDFDCIYEACDDQDMRGLRILLGEQLKADTSCSDYSTSLACALGRASYICNNRILQFLVNKGAEAGLWSRAIITSEADCRHALEVTFREPTTVGLVLAEDPHVLASSAGSMGLTLRFSLIQRG